MLTFFLFFLCFKAVADRYLNSFFHFTFNDWKQHSFKNSTHACQENTFSGLICYSSHLRKNILNFSQSAKAHNGNVLPWLTILTETPRRKSNLLRFIIF